MYMDLYNELMKNSLSEATYSGKGKGPDAALKRLRSRKSPMAIRGTDSKTGVRRQSGEPTPKSATTPESRRLSKGTQKSTLMRKLKVLLKRKLPQKLGLRAGTEYEGLPIKEVTKKLIIKTGRGMIAQSREETEKEKEVPETTPYGKGHAEGQHQAKKTWIGRRVKRLTGKLAARKKRKGKSSSNKYEKWNPANVASDLTADHTEHEGPSLSEADFASALERLKKKKPALARHRVRTEPYPSGLSRGKEKHQQERPYTAKEKAEIKAAIKYYRENPVAVGDTAEESRSKRKFPVKSSTEYEGPSLSENEEEKIDVPHYHIDSMKRLKRMRKYLKRKEKTRKKQAKTKSRGSEGDTNENK